MVEPVNVIIGGSPCQDLSVAGRRAGLAGERSGLFMEQIRIIKEMRCADAARGRTGTDIRPRWMVWENVPGAFSSNKGEDFGAVLQETIKIAEPQVPAVSVPKNGWPTAGCLTDVGGKWSVAWRVFDAQFWGVPQRRKRIALVADFGGLTAPEILFERQGVPGYCPQSGAPWQRAAAPAQDGAAQPGGSTLDATRPDPAKNQGGIAIVQLAVENHPQDSRVKINEDGVVQTLSGQMGTGGECSSDIRKQVADVYAATCGSFMSIGCDVCPTLMARDYKQSHIVCYKDGGTENDYV